MNSYTGLRRDRPGTVHLTEKGTWFHLEVVSQECDLRTIYVLRHQIYCDQMHAYEPQPKGELTDEYDVSATHIVARNENGEIIGAIRNIWKRFPMVEEYGFQPLPSVFDAARDTEVSRIVVRREYREVSPKSVSAHLMFAARQAAMHQGAYHWIYMSTRSSERLLFETLGWTASEYRPSQIHHGGIRFRAFVMDLGDSRSFGPHVESFVWVAA